MNKQKINTRSKRARNIRRRPQNFINDDELRKKIFVDKIYNNIQNDGDDDVMTTG